MSLRDCRRIAFPKIPDARGNLTFIEGARHVPFAIARVYYLYDVPGGAVRGGHAHRELEEVLVAITGSFEVHLDDGKEKKVFTLRTSNEGLLIPRMVWRELHAFTSGAVCLVLASRPFEESDYYRDYAEFVAASRVHDVRE